jgi:hypothetical protein
MKNKIYIFGAHSRARTLAAYLCFLDEDIHIEAYFYDNDEKNPENIGEIPVFKVNGTMDINALNLSLDYPVYIGTRGIFHEKITEMLTEIGFKVIYPVTVEMDLMLRNQYLEKYYSSIGREFIKLDKLQEFPVSAFKDSEMINKISASVYTVKSPFDRPLQQEYSIASYEKEIYAGAVFAENSLPLLPKNALRDNEGENISEKNKQFCELTALYWIWKHAREDILGLVHYRRHFLFPKNWKECMLNNQVDVILPVPLYVAPTVEENFKSRHDPSDWEFMMQYLKDNFPENYQAACRFFKGNLYSPCNMFVMKRDVLDALCSWLFPILFKVAEHGGEKDNSYLNRYPGFISERLISLYFEINREKFKLVYADKNFLP